jgi:hypothetical protein
VIKQKDAVGTSHNTILFVENLHRSSLHKFFGISHMSYASVQEKFSVIYEHKYLLFGHASGKQKASLLIK